MMVLQEVLFPNLDTCSTFEMYFRPREGEKDVWVDAQAGAVILPQWTHLGLDTYFNSFSIGKWRKYTALDNLKLRLELRGEFQVQLVHWVRLKDRCDRIVVAEEICRSDERAGFEIAFPEELAARGVYGFSLYAVGEENAFFGGRYCTEVDDERLNPVDIALDICTFRREAYVEKNIAMLQRDLLRNPDCEARDHLEVFISDNARTLDAARLSSGHVHIFPNRNVGGAGGFTRGMIEIIDAPKAFTHVLLMDDDVLINSDAIMRTYRLLRLLKPEYVGKTVAGALMRLDRRYVQYESGAVIKGFNPKPRKFRLDMRKIKNVLKNEQEETITYNGWWYSCIPMSKISNDNLPLPVFVHRDDIEFGMRTGSDILTLNGICLWHESFDNKYASSMEYYESRNDLIMNALHKPGFTGKHAAMALVYRIVGNVIRYRYNNCELVFKGIDDFCKGPEYLMHLDPEQTHREVLSQSDKFLPLDQLDIPFREKTQVKGLKKNKSFLNTFRIFLLNGLFLPSRGVSVVNTASPWPRNFYRRSAVLNYDEINQTGFVSRRSAKKTMSALFRAVGRAAKLLLRYPRVAESYRRAMPVLTSRAFWDEYLGLK